MLSSHLRPGLGMHRAGTYKNLHEDSRDIMAARRIPGRFYRWLVNELRLWRESGLVTQEKAEEILAFYEAETTGLPSGTPMTILVSGLGGVLLALALLLLIRAGLGDAPAEIQLTFIWLGFLGWHILGFLTLGAGPLKQVLREGIFLAGSVYFGGAIFSVPPILGQDTLDIWGLHAWAAGIWGLAFLLEEAFPVHVLLTYSLLFLGLFSSAQNGSFEGLSFPLPHLVVAVIDLALTIPLLILTYRRRQELAGLFGVAAMAGWLLMFIPPELEGVNTIRILSMVVAVASLVWILGEALPGEGLFKTGLVVAGGLLSLPGWCFLNSRSLYDYREQLVHTPLVLIRPIVIILLVLGLLFGNRVWRPLRSNPDFCLRRLGRCIAGPVFCVVMSLVIYFLSIFEVYDLDLRTACLASAVAGMGVFALWNAGVGLARGNLLQAALGLLAITLAVLLWWGNFFKYSELVGALLFAVVGITMVAGVLVWVRVRASKKAANDEVVVEKNAYPSLGDQSALPPAAAERAVPRWAYLAVAAFQTILLALITGASMLGWFGRSQVEF